MAMITLKLDIIHRHDFSPIILMKFIFIVIELDEVGNLHMNKGIESNNLDEASNLHVYELNSSMYNE